jgi:hypothetical protein
MSLLEELVKSKETVRIDFHNHIQRGDKPEQELSDLFESVSDSKLDILYITDTVYLGGDNKRFLIWTSEERIEEAREKGWEVEVGPYYVFAKKDNSVVGLGHSKEIETNEGHFGAYGVKRDRIITSNISTLEDALKQVNDGELKNMHHPATIWDRKSGILRNRKKPKEDVEKFDALEINSNFCFPFSLSNQITQRIGRKYKKPLLYNTDGHDEKDRCKSYNIFDTNKIEYTSERAFRDSISYLVRNNDFSKRFRPIPLWRTLYHGFNIVFHMLKEKLAKVRERTIY